MSSSYDPYTTTGRASAEGWWRFCNARPWLSGGFVWTGFDYRGEPSPNEWPNISSQYGIIDTCGFPKDTFFYYQSWWTAKPVLHAVPALELAGDGGKRDRGLGLFEPGQGGVVPERPEPGREGDEEGFAPGLERQVCSRSHRGAGFQDGQAGDDGKAGDDGRRGEIGDECGPQEISADGEDVAMFAVEVHDAQGRVVPITDNEVTFTRLRGRGN